MLTAWIAMWVLVVAFVETTRLANKDEMTWWIPNVIGVACIGVITYIFFTVYDKIGN